MFAVPGIGRLFVQSVNARDYGMIMGTTLFYAVVIVVANLAVDIDVRRRRPADPLPMSRHRPP